MSEDENEMVTISYTVTLPEVEGLVDGRRYIGVAKAELDAARAALAARKSKYERWREDIGTAWCKSGDYLIASENRSSRPCIAKPNKDCAWALANWDKMGNLMAAAPAMLDALIDARRQLILLNVVGGCTCSNPDCDNRDLDIVDDAIKLALPPDVAKEQLCE